MTKLTPTQQKIIDKMEPGVKYTPGQLETNRVSLNRLREIGLVKRYRRKGIQAEFSQDTAYQYVLNT